MALTTKQIQSLKPRESRYSISDGNGLTLRVQPSGSKSWVFRSPQASPDDRPPTSQRCRP